MISVRPSFQLKRAKAPTLSVSALVEVEIEAIFGATLAGERDRVVGAEAGADGGERHGSVVGAGEGGVEPGAEANRTGPVIGRVAQFELADIAAAREQGEIEDVGIAVSRLQEVAQPGRPVRGR